MKVAFIAVAVLVAVLQCSAHPVEEEVMVYGNVVDNLIRQALEYVRGVLKANQPYSIPSLPEQSIVNEDINLRVNLTALKISKADDFVVKVIDNNIPYLWAKFDILLPQPYVEGDFQIAGIFLNKTVSGTGSFSINVTSMDQSGKIQMEHFQPGLNIKEIDLDYVLADAKFGGSGLNVQGMTDQQVLDFLNNQLLPTLQQNKAEVCQRFAEVVREKGNEYVQGKTLSEIIAWLKTFIGH